MSALLLLVLLQSVGLSSADCGLAHVTRLAPIPADQVLLSTDCIDVNCILLRDGMLISSVEAGDGGNHTCR